MNNIQSNLRKFLLFVKTYALSLNRRRVIATLCGAVILGITLTDAFNHTEKGNLTYNYSFAAGSLIMDSMELSTIVETTTSVESVSIVKVASASPKSLLAAVPEVEADVESQADQVVTAKTTEDTSGEKETESAKTDTSSEQKTDTQDSAEAETEETETEEQEPQPVISYTEEDYNNLLRIVEAEATGGDLKSKIIVADVVINRVKHSHFPNTISEVIYQGDGEQFQPITDGRFYSVTVTDSTIEAVNRALYGEDYSQGALYFASIAACEAGCWHVTHLTRLFEYGGHVYFTF